MPSDPRKITRTKAWLIKAQRDFKAAEQLLAQDEPLLDLVVYHCQQTAEKALKGYLFWHDIPFRKTHDLVELLDQCIVLDHTLESFQETARLLTPLGVEFRYPGDLLEPPLAEAQDAFARAKALLDAIVERLPDEVAP
jgi:HEPN domain-containing protein